MSNLTESKFPDTVVPVEENKKNYILSANGEEIVLPEAMVSPVPQEPGEGVPPAKKKRRRKKIDELADGLFVMNPPRRRRRRRYRRNPAIGTMWPFDDLPTLPTLPTMPMGQVTPTPPNQAFPGLADLTGLGLASIVSIVGAGIIGSMLRR